MTTQLTSSVVAGPDAYRQRALDTLTKLPPFSPILSKLMASLAGEDVSFLVLGDLIEKDTVVAANILRVVNSAIYARRSTVNSVRHALSVLGVEKVRNTVLAMSISRMLNAAKTPPGWSMERFNKHSAAVAMLSDLLAQKVNVHYPEGAFVAGLLHDVGQLLIAMGLPAEFQAILNCQREDCQREDCQRETQRPVFECEREILGLHHAELSADAMQDWKLPEPIRDAIRQHHDGLWVAPGSPLPLALVLQAANAYVNSLGHTIAPSPGATQGDPALLDPLGLDPAMQEALLAQFHAEHSAIAQYYQ